MLLRVHQDQIAAGDVLRCPFHDEGYVLIPPVDGVLRPQDHLVIEFGARRQRVFAERAGRGREQAGLRPAKRRADDFRKADLLFISFQIEFGMVLMKIPVVRQFVPAFDDLFQALRVVIRPAAGYAGSSLFEEEKGLMASFMGAGELTVDLDGSIDTSQAFPSSALGFEVFTFVKEAVDVPSEIKKLEATIAKNQKSLEGTMKKLSNEQFLANAKSEAIEKEKAKKAEFEELIRQAKEHIAQLEKL